jgi:hypothetical protein
MVPVQNAYQNILEVSRAPVNLLFSHYVFPSLMKHFGRYENADPR